MKTVGDRRQLSHSAPKSAHGRDSQPVKGRVACLESKRWRCICASVDGGGDVSVGLYLAGRGSLDKTSGARWLF